jgi:translocation and assembly module TamB
VIRRIVSSMLLLTVLGIAGTLAWLAGSESGARVVIAYVSGITPGFSMRHAGGTLAGPLQLQRIVIKNGETRVEADTLLLDWSLPCLLVGEFCLRELRAGRITLSLPPPVAPVPGAAPRRLPTLRAPLTIDAGLLQVDEFLVLRDGKTTRYTQLAGALNWRDDVLRVDRLVVGMPGWQSSTSGTLATRDDWPLQAMVSFRVPRTGDSVFSLQGSADGSLQDARLHLASAGLVDALLEGSLQPLQRGLPFSASARIARFSIPPRGAAEKSAQLQEVTLSARGELLGTFTLSGKATLDTPWTPPLPARLAGASGNWRGLDHAELLIEDPRLRARIRSDYRWLDGQHFNATIDVEHLDLALVNAATPSRLAGQLQVTGAVDRSGTAFDVGVSKLGGTFRQWPLQATGTLQWREVQWLFAPLDLAMGNNGIRVSGRLGEQWHATAALRLDDLGVLVPAIGGRGTGSAAIRGAPTDPRFAVTLDTREFLLPEVSLPAPLSRRVRLPAADWRIEGEASLGDFRISRMQTANEQAFALQARGLIDWRKALNWDIDTDVISLALADLLPELAGEVHGAFSTAGTLGASLENLRVRTQLDGEALDLPLALQAGLDWSPQRTRIDRLHLRHGDNRVHLNGAFEPRDDDLSLALDADIDAPRLADSIGGLDGAVSLRAAVNGLRSRPDLRATGRIDALSWREWKIGNLTLDADVRDGFHAGSSARLAGSQLARAVPGQAGQMLQSFGAVLDGSREQHTLALAARAAPNTARLQLTGNLQGKGLDDFDWRGRLGASEVVLDGWAWANTGDAGLRVRGESAQVEAHCWSDGSARACLTREATFGREGEAALEVFHLPVSALLDGLLPIDTRVTGRVGGWANAQWNARGITRLEADVRNAEAISLTLNDGDEERKLGDVEQLRASVTLDGDAGRVEADLHGEQLGTLSARGTLGPGAPDELAQRQLQARVKAANVQVALLEAFTYQLRDIGGTLGGSVDITGTPARPAIAGRFAFANGRAAFTRLPLSLNDIQLDSEFDGGKATFAGTFRTADSSGLGRVNGTLDLNGGQWHADGRLTGEGVVFTSPPEFQFSTTPDLALVANRERIAVNGSVRVDAGRIELKSLPAQSVRRSRDVVLVSAEEVIDSGGIGFRQNIDVNFVLGDDVNFRAFGGAGRLTGDLRVRSTPELPLLVNGELHVGDGKYTAFGQQLTLKQADILFNGPADQPLIDALAYRSFDDATVREAGLRLTGSLRAPQTTLWSTPTMPDEEALSWLATGRPLAEGPVNLRGEAAQAALSLGIAQGSALLTQAGQEIGLQDVQLAATGDGDEAEVQVGTNLNEKIYVGYNRRVFTGDESVLLRLHLTRRLMLEALSGLESALDIFYTFEF